jgi:hypothetical protein
MDVINCAAKRFNQLTVRNGLPKIQAFASGFLSAKKHSYRKLWGLTALATAVFLAVSADRISSSEALRTWKKGHPPSPAVWTSVLTANGYNRVSEQAVAAKVIGKLPLTADSQASVWFSESLENIVVFEGTQDTTPAVYSLLAAKQRWVSARNWDLAGIGWDGLEYLTVLIEKKKKAIPPKIKQKRPPLTDFRQLTY